MIELEINRFFNGQGRRPRVLISPLVQKNQDRGINEASPRQTATHFAQYGFDVDISPDHMAPEQLVKMAVDNDVHLLCLLSNGELGMEFLDSLLDALRNFSCEDVQVVCCPSNPAKPFNKDRTTGEAGPLRINPGDADDVLRLLKKLTRTL
ncbi:MAG: hypothetical protein K9K62_12310 [Desulfobacteraceae bacterium]|nr:hypothetical protein [Desulfobacteraceae bacterium]MCF8037646.1 hypothetical protein [Desulfobacteraceae bacterium]